MGRATARIHCKTKLLRPAQPKDATWSFIVLPKSVSAKLPTRSVVTVDATLDGLAFQAMLEPDGEGSHWFKVEKIWRDALGATAGGTIDLEIAPVAEEPEPAVPPDLREAIGTRPEALATWRDITPVARRDWIHWITSGKKMETRVKRISVACDKLATGQRRACCFDRSGMYSKGSMGAPRAAE